MANINDVRNSKAFKDIGGALMTALGYGEFFKAEDVNQGKVLDGVNANSTPDVTVASQGIQV